MALRVLKILKNSGLSYLCVRTIMSSNFKLKKVEEELEKNPYFGKYQEKIQKLRKEKPEDYYSRMKVKEEQKKTKDEKRKQVQYPEPKGNNVKGETTKKCLGDILKLEMVENKSADEIKNLWIDYHRGKDILYSTYSNDQYEKLDENYIKFPTFVFPLPRGDGYEFFLFQHSENELHFTPMVQYKKHGANAPECLSVAYFPDLKNKDIILMRGEYDKDILSSLESQCLLNITHMFYNGDSEKRISMVEMFNKKPDEFKFPEIISEVERLGFNISSK